MKIDTLSFLNCILIHHQPTVFLPHIKTLVPVGKPHFYISNGLGFTSATSGMMLVGYLYQSVQCRGQVNYFCISLFPVAYQVKVFYCQPLGNV